MRGLINARKSTVHVRDDLFDVTETFLRDAMPCAVASIGTYNMIRCVDQVSSKRGWDLPVCQKGTEV
jgi:hypothetical protein